MKLSERVVNENEKSLLSLLLLCRFGANRFLELNKEIMILIEQKTIIINGIIAAFIASIILRILLCCMFIISQKT